MGNYFTDNQDLQFTLEHLDLTKVVELLENGYTECKKFEAAPENYEDAMDNFRRVLTVAGQLCEERIAQRSDDVDKEGPTFENGEVKYHPLTAKNLEELSKAGLNGVILPREYGGLNWPLTIYTMITELISRADGSLQNIFALQNIAATIGEFGSEDQKQRYLPRFNSGEADGSMDLTEPDSGSDLQSVRLKATQDENGQWYLDGVKRFITNGNAKIHLVLARSEAGTTDGRGLSMFICEKTPQLVVRRIEHKLGIHGVPTCELQFNHVPAELCGMRKRGLIKYVMSLMNGARISISAQAVGIAEAAYREARKYASERQQFKQSIEKFPAIYEMLTNMKLHLTAARAVLYETTKNVDLRNTYTKLNDNTKPADPKLRDRVKVLTAITDTLTPMSKAYSTETANQVAYDCIQIHGGSGYMQDFVAERYYRDARITNIYEGTTQLQVVAAIGGVMARSLDPIYEPIFRQLKGQDYAGSLKNKLRDMQRMQEQAIEYVTSLQKVMPEYRTIHARELVDNETYLLAGLLLLRDGQYCTTRSMLAEQYINQTFLSFRRNYESIMDGASFLEEQHNRIINY